MTMRAGEVYEHPYERLVVRVGTAESDGRELVADLYVRADVQGVPRHIHPTVEESLTVVRGSVAGWLPGCPPRPEAVIYGIVMLQKKIDASKM